VVRYTVPPKGKTNFKVHSLIHFISVEAFIEIGLGFLGGCLVLCPGSGGVLVFILTILGIPT